MFIQVMFSLTLFVGTMLRSREETLNDSIAFFDRRRSKDEHRTGVVLVVKGLHSFVDPHRTVENQGEETRLSVKETNVTEVFARQGPEPQRSDLELFALHVELDGCGRRTENRTFEELLDFPDQIALRGWMMIDVEIAEEIDRGESVDRLVMEGQGRLRIDQIHSGSQGGVHVFQKNDIVDLR